MSIIGDCGSRWSTICGGEEGCGAQQVVYVHSVERRGARRSVDLDTLELDRVRVPDADGLADGIDSLRCRDTSVLRLGA
jgi:hypothetical protein